MRRIDHLDTLRGFALCGILFANAPALLHLSPIRDDRPDPVYTALGYLVDERFFPVFATLFGISFALMWRSARTRTASPRRVLAQRLITIGVLGALHQLFQPGEALLPYALAGLIVLLPATLLPDRWVPACAGVVGAALLAGAVATTGGVATVPGLFLIGYATGMADLPARIDAARDRGGRAVHAVTALVVCAALTAAVAAAALQYADPRLSAAAGIVTAAAYSALVVAADRGACHRLLAPLRLLGRTALTNYLGATAALLALRAVAGPLGLGTEDTQAWPRMVIACAVILVCQAAVTALWLRRFAQGPLEHVVRTVSRWGVRPTAPTSAPAPRAVEACAPELAPTYR